MKIKTMTANGFHPSVASHVSMVLVCYKGNNATQKVFCHVSVEGIKIKRGLLALA